MGRLGQIKYNFFSFAAALLALVAAQYWLGAFDAEIVGDSASHYVSGIFIADLLRGGIFHPTEKLKDFAAHYPMVGIGHWPPLYYGIEAVWSFLAPFDRRMALLSSMVAALVAATLFALLRPRLALVPAAFGATAFVLCSLILSEVTILMLDIPVTLGCLIAAICFARFLNTGRPLPAILFALIAAATLLVKGNAGCLMFLPPLAIAITGRYERLRSPWLWIGIPIVLVIAGPWYFFTHKMVEVGYRGTLGFDYAIRSLQTDLLAMFTACGAGILVAAFFGVWTTLRQSRSLDPIWGTLFALILSVLIFQAIIPVALEARYVIPALPPLFALAAFGASRLPNRSMTYAAFVVMLLLLLPGIGTLTHRPNMGVQEAIKTALRQMPSDNRALLIVSDADGEGAAITELVRQRNPQSEVFGVRGVRLLGGGGYNNQDYRPRYKTLKEVAGAIQTYCIPMVLLREPDRTGAWAHIQQIADLISRYPSDYQLVWAGTGGKLYKVTSNFGMPGHPKQLVALSAPRALGGDTAVSP